MPDQIQAKKTKSIQFSPRMSSDMQKTNFTAQIFLQIAHFCEVGMKLCTPNFKDRFT